jgi:membrane protein required for colicin V production
MVEAQLNYFDMAIYTIMGLSCIFAFFRGFVKEILSLIAWIGAAAITVRFFPEVSEKLQPHFAKPLAANIVATLSLYFGSLIVFAIFNRIIIKVLKSGTEIGWFDNFLGFAFGGIRGAFIISLGYLLMMVVIKDESRPEWLEKAKTRPYAEKGALMLANIAPKYVEELSSMQQQAKEKAEDSASGVTETIGSTDVDNIENNVKDSSDSFEQLLKNLGKK